MKRKSLLIMISLFFFCAFIPNIIAEETKAYVTATALRIRKEANTNSDTLIKIYSGETITITDLNKVTGEGCNSGWYKVNYNSYDGYVCSEYVKIGSINNEYNTSSYSARVYANSVSIRKTANSNATKLDSLINGVNLKIIETLAPGNGCNNNWYKVIYNDNKQGYICGTYVTKKEDITASDAEYEEVLKDFPESYRPYLVYLHQKHPAWTFKAIKTNLKWANVVDGESGKNYIQTTQDAYRTSSKPTEGSTWFESTDGVNAFFLDPRNFLTEKFIFMFENLGFDKETQTAEIVKSIFGSSYLAEDEYVKYFLEAGEKYGVSPVHLAARVTQEGGSKSTYASITGTYTGTYRGKSLKGYYNYYNIGAYADSYTSDPVVRGLAYAAGYVGGDGKSYGRPWNTREKAIHGGAQFISNGYITSGQYTLYFEKFNTSPTSSNSKYTHQYMTNVQAPTSEASNVYSSYNGNKLLDNAYVFAIPVYEDMPDTVSLPVIGDVVNTLSSIKINGSLISEFDPDVLSYTYYISKDTTEIEIDATSTSSLGTVEGNGKITLDTDETTLTIKVTSQTGDIKIYTVLVKKIEDTQTIQEIINNLEYKVNENYMSNIESGTISNNVVASIKKHSTTALVTISDSTGVQIKSTDILGTGYIVKIKTITGEEKSFTTIIKGDTSGDGKVTILDLLQVQKDILNSKKLSNAYFKAGDTSGDDKITILDLLQIQKYLVEGKKL